MAQAAYDFSRFESREQEPRPQVRAVKGSKSASRFNASKAKLVAVAFVMLALVWSFLNSQATLTEITADIQKTQKQLVNAQSDYNYLSGVMDSKTSLKNVEEIATGQLGLMKLDKSQITYFSLENESLICRPETTGKRLTEFFTTGMLSLMEQLNP